jgi:hypothetical protein
MGEIPENCYRQWFRVVTSRLFVGFKNFLLKLKLIKTSQYNLFRNENPVT